MGDQKSLENCRPNIPRRDMSRVVTGVLCANQLDDELPLAEKFSRFCAFPISFQIIHYLNIFSRFAKITHQCFSMQIASSN